MTCPPMLDKRWRTVKLLRHVRRREAIALLIAVVLGAGAAPASATTLGPWHQLPNSTGSNIDEVGLVRGDDGVLHAASLASSASKSALWETSISPSGALGGSNVVASGWAMLSNPALAIGLGGSIDAIFGGIRSLNFGDPQDDMNMAVSTNGGASWTLVPGDIVAQGAAAYSSPVAVATGVSGQLLETWYGTSGVWVHSGVSSVTPNSNFQSFGCCGYYSNVAIDANSDNQLAWYSNASGHLGVWTEAVGSDGSPLGSPIRMPGTANMSVGEDQRTPLVAGPNRNFYIAYPTGYPSFRKIALWAVYSSTTRTIANLSSGSDVNAGLAADPNLRLWVFWSERVGSSPRLFATRSNLAGTRFGAVVRVGAPPRASSVYSVDGNAGSGALDIFGTIAVANSSTTATWTRHVLPGLSVGLSPAAVRRRHLSRVTVTVTDAGAPVKGASVKLGGHTSKTNGSGRVTLHLLASGPLAAVASHAGYVDGTAKLRVAR